MDNVNKLYESYRDNDLQFEIKRHYVENYRLHFHFATEVCYVINGNFNYRIGGVRGEATKGDILFIHSNEIHEYHKKEKCEVIICIISNDYMTDFNNEYDNAIFDVLLANKTVNSEIYKMFYEMFIKQAETLYLEQKAFVNLFLSKLYRNYSISTRKKSDELIIEIFEYIYENYKSEITLETIANHFSYSRMFISKIFSSQVNMDFRLFVNNIRVEQVNKRLFDEKYKDNSILEIATDCGFDSMATFYRTYKRIFHVLPKKNK